MDGGVALTNVVAIVENDDGSVTVLVQVAPGESGDLDAVQEELVTLSDHGSDRTVSR